MCTDRKTLAPIMAMEPMTLDIDDVPSLPLQGQFRLGVTGDLIYLRPMAATLKAQRPDLVKELLSTDVLIGNLETVLLELDTFSGSPQAQSGGTWMLADPAVAADLKSLGFSVLGLANNHATDWGVEALLGTREHLDAAGIQHAGAGRSMSQARSACYVDAPQGRLGFLAASATFTPMSPAADPLGRVPGRPGINTLRTTPYSAVNPADYERLAGLAETTFSGNVIREGSLKLMGGEFEPDASVPEGSSRLEYRVEERDAQEILRQVRQAKQNSSLVVFGFHYHEPANAAQEPAAFAAEFSRRVVDAGADVVVSHGPHQLRGIELYKGAPIFHSLGNFAMMTNSLDSVPRETYDLYGLSPEEATVPELLSARNAAVFGKPEMSESVFPVLEYREGRLTSVELVPLDIAPDIGAALGTPAKADEEKSSAILQRLQNLSAPFGTSFTSTAGRTFLDLAKT